MANLSTGQKVTLYLIRFYQKAISLDSGFLRFFLKPFFFNNKNSCRYTPSCSEYTYQAVRKYGIISGLLFGVKRIVRCHPFAPGGHDPVK